MFDSYVDINDEICLRGSNEEKEVERFKDVPKWNYNPRYSGFPTYCQHGSNVPGTWTGASNPFVNLAYISNYNKHENLSTKTSFSDPEQRQDHLDCKAVISAFGTLLPTACYLGFDPMNDPTRYYISYYYT